MSEHDSERKTPHSPEAGGNGKYITLGVLLLFVAAIFGLTVLKFAKVL